MFGYILPDKPELKIREFTDYKAVYCALCGALRGFGPGAKALLNYDFTFAAMLMMAVQLDTPPKLCEGRCNTNCLEKVGLIPQNSQLRYCAAALIISSRYKLQDNMRDEIFVRKVGARLLLFLLRPAIRRAQVELPGFDAVVREQMAKQASFEQSGIDSLDRACDPTARSLASLFSGMSEEREKSGQLERLGYLLGRYVYLADSADDLKKDLQKGRYNPMILRFSLNAAAEETGLQEAQWELKAQLHATIAQIEVCYHALELNCYREILDNIIYRGLYKVAQDVGKKRKGKRKP